jgi:hypothetical protein
MSESARASVSVVAPSGHTAPAQPGTSVREARPQRAPPPVPARASFPARMMRAVGGLGPYLQYQLAKVGIAGVTGVGVAVAAVVFAVATLLPGHDAVSRLDQEIARAQALGRAHGKPVEDGITRLVTSLPTRGQMPAILGLVLEQAQKAGVALDSGRYTYTPAKGGHVGRYEMEFPVKAAYPNIRDFIDRTLNAIPAAGLDKLRVERKAVGESVVNADVRFVVFVRGEA